MSRKMWPKDIDLQHNAVGYQMIPCDDYRMLIHGSNARLKCVTLESSAKVPHEHVLAPSCSCGHSFAYYDLRLTHWLCEACGSQAGIGHAGLIRATWIMIGIYVATDKAKKAFAAYNKKRTLADGFRTARAWRIGQ